MHTQRSTLSAVTVAVAALGLLTACGTEKAGSEGSKEVGGAPEASVAGQKWQVESVTVDGRTTKAAVGAAHVAFKDGKATGNLGCNGFGGEASVEGDSVKVGKLIRTQMACGKKITGFENRAIKALSDGSLKAAVDGDRLTLTAGNGDRIALTSKPAAPLAGTKWKVGSLVDDKAARSLPKEVEAHLTFGKDGTVRGNLGCNDVTAKADVRDNGKIALGPAGATRKMCPGDEMKTERALLALFGKTVDYTHEDDRLTLTNPADGKGVAAKAATDATPGAGEKSGAGAQTGSVSNSDAK